jgi:hypothetical protein
VKEVIRLKNFRIIAIALLVFVFLMGLTVSAYAQDKVKVKVEEKKACCEGKELKCAGCTKEAAVKGEATEHVCTGECKEACEKHAAVKGAESEHVCTEACKEACTKAKLPEGHPKMKEGATAGHEHATEVHGADKKTEGGCCAAAEKKEGAKKVKAEKEKK